MHCLLLVAQKHAVCNSQDSTKKCSLAELRRPQNRHPIGHRMPRLRPERCMEPPLRRAGRAESTHRVGPFRSFRPCAFSPGGLVSHPARWISRMASSPPSQMTAFRLYKPKTHFSLALENHVLLWTAFLIFSLCSAYLVTLPETNTAMENPPF